MISRLCDRSIRTLPRGWQSRPAFTLAEMVVSIGILAVLLAIAGEVMSLTVNSTGQAMALTKVNESFRILEQTLRRDLAGIVRPGPGVDEPSLLLIQANAINAYWEQNGKDGDSDANPGNGYPYVKDPTREMTDPSDSSRFLMSRPRADIVMFFTRSEGRSLVNYTYPDASPTRGAANTPLLSGWKQVVYGHANLGEYLPPESPSADAPDFEFVPNTAAFEDSKDTNPLPVSPVPAERWHLARRVLHLTADFQNAQPDPWADLLETPEPQSFDWEPILLGQTDIIGNASGSKSYASLVVEPHGATGWPEILSDADMRPFARSRIDMNPPPTYADRLGQYFIPNCASFKVEWTLDPRSEFVGGRLDGERQVYWFDPGDLGEDFDDPADDRPLRSLQNARDTEDKAAPGSDRYWRLRQLLEGSFGGNPSFAYSLQDRFESNPVWHGHVYDDGKFRPNLVAFTALREIGGELVAEDIFPAALRITVDVYDEERRLEKPIRHVMVIPVGTL